MSDDKKNRNDELDEILREAREMRLSRTQELDLLKKQQQGEERLPQSAHVNRAPVLPASSGTARTPAQPQSAGAAPAARSARPAGWQSTASQPRSAATPAQQQRTGDAPSAAPSRQTTAQQPYAAQQRPATPQNATAQRSVPAQGAAAAQNLTAPQSAQQKNAPQQPAARQRGDVQFPQKMTFDTSGSAARHAQKTRAEGMPTSEAPANKAQAARPAAAANIEPSAAKPPVYAHEAPPADRPADPDAAQREAQIRRMMQQRAAKQEAQQAELHRTQQLDIQRTQQLEAHRTQQLERQRLQAEQQRAARAGQAARQETPTSGFPEYGTVEFEMPQTPAPDLEAPATNQAPPRKKDPVAKRSVFGSLVGEKPATDSQELDPINKEMLAPTIERGVDVAQNSQELPKISKTQELELADAATYAENHPLFTQTLQPQAVIPKENKEELYRSQQRAKIEQDKTRTVVMTETEKRIAKKSVLNVRENVDDNFREFFGDTVIIDRESLNDKAKRQRKIKDFVVANKEGEVGGPVFEDEDETADEETVDYRSDEDTEAVLGQLLTDKGRALFSVVLTGVLGLVTLILNVMAEFRVLPEALSLPNVYYIVNIALFAVVFGVHYRTVFGGFIKLVTFKATPESLVSFGCVAALAEAVVLLVTGGEEPAAALCGCVAIGALFFSALGKYLRAVRVLNSFRTVSESFEKYASAVLDDQNFTRRLSRELEISSPRVLIKRKTGFTDNFLQHSYSSSGVDGNVRLLGSILFVVSLLCGVIGFFRDGGLSGAARAAALCAAFVSPFVSTLAGSLPIYCMQKQLSRLGAVMPGYSAAEEVCDANCVVLEGRELFPKGNVMLHGIKTFEKERIDKAILYAASVLIQSCDTMSHVFLNVIQNKTEMLYDVDGIEYEAGLGFSFWVDKSRVLLGTRELLKVHEIDVPSRDYENRYTKSSTRDAIYLAVSGKLYAMFVLSYAPNAEVEEALQAFEREGVSIIVHTRDFNITPEKISRVYKIPRKMISVVNEGDMAELAKKTEYVGHAPSALTHIGSLTSFVKGIIACYNVRSAVRLTTSIEFACMILGAVAAVALALFGLVGTIGVMPILFFQSVCSMVLILVAAAHKY